MVIKLAQQTGNC